MKFTTALSITLALACSACEQRGASRDQPARATPRAAVSAAGENPFATAPPVDAADAHFVGRVVQRLDAGSYVYLEVDRPGSGPTWVVTAEALTPDAERVSVQVVKRVEHFESRRLRRSFSPLSFAIVRKEDG